MRAAVAGRKHQLRIQCAGLGAPVVGDARYGRTRSPAQLALARADAPGGRETCPTEAALARLLGCTTPLQLHCSRVRAARSGDQHAQPAGRVCTVGLIRITAALQSIVRSLLRCFHGCPAVNMWPPDTCRIGCACSR